MVVAPVLCKWKYADAGRGVSALEYLANMNPLRWSSPLPLETVRDELKEIMKISPHRPINLLLPADSPKADRTMFGDASAAIAALEDNIAQAQRQSSEGNPPSASEEDREKFRRKVAVKRAKTFAARYEPSKPVTTMVFKGGGTKGIVYSGAIQRFEQADGELMKAVQKFAGTSAGSQTAALLASGYTGRELADLGKNSHWEKLVDHSKWFKGGITRDLVNIVEEFGFSPGNYLEETLDDLIAAKCDGKKHITFEDHYEMHKKELVMGVVNLKTRQFEYLSKDTHPKMPVSKAARASSSVPVVFVPVKWEGSMYVDGGLAGNLPIDAFGIDASKERMVAFNLNKGDSETEGVPADFNEFIKLTFGMLMDATQSQYGLNGQDSALQIEEKGIHLVQIDTKGFGMLDTTMNDTEIEALMHAGYDAACEYFIGYNPNDEIYLGQKETA